MKLHMRSYLTLILVLAVTLTAHSAGAMRGMRDATGQMVICSGTGPVVIYVDADGQPARAPGNCPDCIMLAMDLSVAPEQMPMAMPRPKGRVQQSTQVRLSSRMVLQARARAPPFVC
mgnify:CR=1 FL=1